MVITSKGFWLVIIFLSSIILTFLCLLLPKPVDLQEISDIVNTSTDMGSQNIPENGEISASTNLNSSCVVVGTA
jgi:hypothetical protein